ncbi:STAS-like domain-containing protein [Photobacterium phosphoreum]|uniref:STAS-like domain-containing protein n=1 Tax=Photobacterium phosphoreum TaxID=659 RepID=UPI0039AF30F3
MKILNIGQKFSDDPQGRYYSDGPGSGEEFREKYLRPLLNMLKKDEKLTIILDDGVDGYGSSFLTEGFAALVKHGYIQAQDLINKIEFKYDDEDFAFYEQKVFQYINEAIFDSEIYKPTKPL